MKLPGLGLIVCCSLLGGCVGQLRTTPYRERTENVSGALRGVTYALPKLVYDTKLTRWLSECPNDITAEGKPTALKFSVDIAATPRMVAGEAYTIDYERLAGFLRTSNFEIKYYENGTLKSIGAGAEDHSAEVIKDTVKTGLAIASAAAGVPPITTLPEGTDFKAYFGRIVGGGSDPARRFDGVACTATAKALVTSARDLTGQLKTRGDAVTNLNKQIERIERRATLKLVTRHDREQLLRHFAELDEHTAIIAQLKEALGSTKEALGVSEAFVWDSAWNQSGANQILVRDLDAKAQQKFALLLVKDQVLPLAGEDLQADSQRRLLFANCYGAKSDPVKCAREQLALEIRVALDSPMASCTGSAGAECIGTADSGSNLYRNARDHIPDSGLFVREPAEGRLLFCRLARRPCDAAKDEANLTQTAIPQLGQLRYLPLKVGTFQAREMSLSLTKDGRIDTFGYKSTKSAGRTLAATAADVATQIDAAMEKRETERRDDIKYAREQETVEVQSEITRLTKELELRKAQDALAPDPLKAATDEAAALKADIAVLEAQLAKLKAEAALTAYRTTPDDS